MMKLNDFIDAMEEIAPASLAWERDNVGLLIGTGRTQINRILVALDCTSPVVEEAIRIGADLVLCHHPLLFHPVRRVLPDDPNTAAVRRLLQHDIAMFAAHTNLDAADGGVNDCLAAALNLVNTRKAYPDPLMRISELAEPMTLSAFSRRCASALNAEAAVVGDRKRMIRSVVLVGGAGGDLMQQAADLGADAFVTGEITHHEALTALERDQAVITLGHYASEAVVLKPLICRLQKYDFDVQYDITQVGCAPFAHIREVTDE